MRGLGPLRAAHMRCKGTLFIPAELSVAAEQLLRRERKRNGSEVDVEYRGSSNLKRGC